MDPLERYLDQVCRSIGGPRPLRDHVRQELREHLHDAAARHRAAGLSDEAAVAQALAEFGHPEQVRSELEATHGHRAMAVVIDTALRWKEGTMRAKWLWATGAHLGLALVIALEAAFITFLVVFIVPRFHKLMRDGIIDPAVLDEHGVSWMPAYLNSLSTVAGGYTTWLVLGAAVLWGLFEWRVKSENKSLMRLAVMGGAAVKLLAVIVLATGSMLVSMMLAAPATGQMARPFAAEQVKAVDTAAEAVESAVAKPDWAAATEQADRASAALTRLTAGPALASLTGWEPPTTDDLRARVKEAQDHLRAVRQALDAKGTDRATAELAEFRKAFAPVREAARREGR
jgi:hypothetical protein